MWYFPSEPGNGNVDELSGRTVTAVNASGTPAAGRPVDVVGPEVVAVDDDPAAGAGAPGLDPGPPGEHPARANAAARRNAVWRAARPGRVIETTSRTIPCGPLLRKSRHGHPISWSPRPWRPRSSDAAASTLPGEPAGPVL